MEDGGGPVEVLSCRVGRRDFERGPSDGGVRVSAHPHRGDDSVVATAAAAQCPEEIAVLSARCRDNQPRSRDDLHLERLVSSEPKLGTKQRVAATLKVATGHADSGAFAGDNNETRSTGGLHGLVAKDASSEGGRGALVMRIRPGREADALQLICPDAQGPCAGRTTEEAANGGQPKALSPSAMRLTHSWPVLRTTRRTLFEAANATPATTSAVDDTLMA